MKNYQHTLYNNTLHLMLSAEIISDFYLFSAKYLFSSKTENANRHRIIDTLVNTTGVPIIYRTVGALKAGLSDLHKSTTIADVVALSPQPGRYNTDDTLITFHGVVYNEELICDKFHRDCLVVPLIGISHRNKEFQIVDRTEVAIGDTLNEAYINNDRRQYYLRALLVVDMDSPDLVHIQDMEDGDDKYRALIKYITSTQ